MKPFLFQLNMILFLLLAYSFSSQAKSNLNDDGETHIVVATGTYQDFKIPSNETDPIAICQDIEVTLSEYGFYILNPSELDGSNIDQSEVSFTASRRVLDCDDLGVQEVILTAKNAQGTRSSCTAQVTVKDNTTPTAICIDDLRSDQGLFDENGMYVYRSFNTIGQSFTAGITGSMSRIRVLLGATIEEGTIAPTVEILEGEGINGPLISSVESVPMPTDEGSFVLFQDITFLTPVPVITGNKYTIVIRKNGIPDTRAAAELLTWIRQSNAYPNGSLFINNSSASYVYDMLFETFVTKDKPLVLALNDSGTTSLSANAIDGGSTDVCGIANLSIDKSSFDCSNVGENTVTLTVTDIGGNSSSCQATIMVEDPVVPEALCRDITVPLDGDGETSISTTDIDNGSNDACGIANLSLDLTTFGCEDVGSNTVTLTVTDDHSNSKTCTAIVTVKDNTAPNAYCKDLTIQLDDNGLAAITIAAIDDGSNDVCGLANLSLDKSSFDCSNIGDNTVILTATDIAGNNSSCQAIVKVEDRIAPEALCQDITVQLDYYGESSISAAEIDNGSNDDCGIASLFIDKANFDCSNVGDNTVTLTVTDNNGNSSICQSTVVVVDETTPTLTCPENMTVNTDPGECGAYVNLPKAATSDNCGAPTLLSQYRPIADNDEWDPLGDFSSWASDHSGFFEPGFYEIRWRATDQSDNNNYCVFTLRLVDEELPEVVCKDVTITFNGEAIIPLESSSIIDEVASFDACGEVVISSQSINEFSCESVGEVVAVQVVGMDPNGNTNTCTAQVSVVGIPCGFEATDIDCENGASATYDPVEDSYTLNANDCEGYPDGQYSLVTTELCGDGEIIAKVSSLNGDGRAGVIMMENLTPDARFVSSIKDQTRRVRTEYRSSTGGNISYKSKNRSRVDWLRIVRDGSKFKTYTSTNGYYWSLSHTINFSNFDDCIKVGLLVYTKDEDEPVSATFDNVKVIGDSPNTLEQADGIPVHALQGIEEQEGLTNSGIGLEVAPNPFAEQTQIEFTLHTASDVTLEIYNLHGQRVQSLENAQLDAGIHRYQWDGQSSKGESLPTGIYMLRLHAGERWFTTKVSLVNR